MTNWLRSVVLLLSTLTLGFVGGEFIQRQLQPDVGSRSVLPSSSSPQQGAPASQASAPLPAPSPTLVFSPQQRRGIVIAAAPSPGGHICVVGEAQPQLIQLLARKTGLEGVVSTGIVPRPNGDCTHLIWLPTALGGRASRAVVTWLQGPLTDAGHGADLAKDAPTKRQLTVVLAELDPPLRAEDVGPGFKIGSHHPTLAPLARVIAARLPAQWRALVLAGAGRPIAPAQRSGLAAALERLRDDRGLISAVNAAFGAEGAALPQAVVRSMPFGDVQLLQQLVLAYDPIGLLDATDAPLSAHARRALRAINGAVIALTLRRDLRSHGELKLAKMTATIWPRLKKLGCMPSQPDAPMAGLLFLRCEVSQ